jgi:hypothetical protein
MKLSFLLLPIAGAASLAVAQAPAPTWTAAQTKEILDKTLPIRLAPDLAHLTAGERTAVAKLIEAGRIFQELYEEQRHHQALAAKGRLRAGSSEATLYRLFNGPIATTLDNRVVPFLPVSSAPPGKNVYPLDLTEAEYEAFLAANPQRRSSSRISARSSAAPTAPAWRATSRRCSATRRSISSITGLGNGFSGWRGDRTASSSTDCPTRSPTRRGWCGHRRCCRKPRMPSSATTSSSPATCAIAPATC